MTTWEKLLASVKDIAPALAGAAATAATGNPLAGAAVIALARKLTGAGPDVDLDEVAADILGDPEKIQQFRLAMRQLELDELRIRTLDVQDARKTLPYSPGTTIVSTIVVVAYFAAVLTVMWTEIPPGSQNIAYLLLGNLGTGFGMVLTFWLGSSVGSKQKDSVNAAYADAAKSDSAARLSIAKQGGV